jgi:hypothetical protein
MRDPDRSVHVGVVDGLNFVNRCVCRPNTVSGRARVVDQHIQPVGVLPSCSRRPELPWPGTRTQQVSSALPMSNAATRWMIWSLSCVSSSTPASLRSDDQRAVARRSRRARGESDPRARGDSEGPTARLPAPGLSTASDDQGHPASAGNHPNFHPGTGAAGRHQGLSANAGNRCANSRSPRSHSTVEAEVMCSHRVQLCALIARHDRAAHKHADSASALIASSTPESTSRRLSNPDPTQRDRLVGCRLAAGWSATPLE